MRLEVAYLLLISIVLLIILLMILIIYQKYQVHKKHKLQGAIRDDVFQTYFDGLKSEASYQGKLFFDVFIDIETQVVIEEDVRARIIIDLLNMKFTKKMIKQLNSKSSYRRRIAVYYVSHLKTEASIKALKDALMKEKHLSVKFYMAYYMMPFIDKSLFQYLVSSLYGASLSYQRWMRVLFRNQYKYIESFIEIDQMDMSNEYIHLLLDIANEQLSDTFKFFTIRILNDDQLDLDLRKKAINVLLKQYPHLLRHESYLNHQEVWIKKKAILSLPTTKDDKVIETLIHLSESETYEYEVIEALSILVKMIKNI